MTLSIAAVIAVVAASGEVTVDAGVDAGAMSPQATDIDGGTFVETGPTVINPLAGLYDGCPAVEYADGGHAEYAFPVKRTGSFIEELAPDAGATSDWYTPYPRPQRASCRLAACEERVKELDSWGRGLNLPWWAAVSIAVTAAGLAAWGTYELCVRVPVVCGGR